MSLDEAEELAQRAHASGYRSVSEYVRARTLDDDTPRRISPIQQHAELIRALSRIGDGLKCAIAAAPTSPAHAELEACLEALCDALFLLA